MLKAIIAWYVAAMTSWSPHPWHETQVQMEARYEATASTLANIVYAPDYQPITHGANARAVDGILALGIARYESGGFRVDVDSGKVISEADHDKSFCAMQVNELWLPTSEGWKGMDLVHDREKCFTIGLRLMRKSYALCSTLDVRDRLSGYTVGHCVENEPHARRRAGIAVKWMQDHPVPVADEDVIKEEG